MCHAITSIKQEMCASRNMPVYINYQTVKKIIFIVMVTLTFDPKIKRVLPLRLPQGNHVVKFGKDPIYRNLCGCPPTARHTQSHNTAHLKTGV